MTSSKSVCLGVLTAILLTAGCRTTKPSESSEMNDMMNSPMKMLRDQLQASGATAKQLRDFDRTSAQMSKSMNQVERQMERQMRALDQSVVP